VRSRGPWIRVKVVLLLFASGCATVPRERVPTPIVGPKKITTVTSRVPRAGELPGLVGDEQAARVENGDTLLDIAREAGLGYQQVQDANPGVDAWIPKPGTEVVLPSRWILPRSRHRGVVINLPEMRLYLYPGSTAPGEEVEIRTFAIGIGADETPSPVRSFSIRTKEKNPTWVVPPSILKTMDPPRRVVPPGPDNPLGAYRMRLSYGLYSIHGTDSPWSIGRLATHGCIRLYPEDIGELFRSVQVGTPGEILYQPVKLGEAGGRIYVEVHPDIYRRVRDLARLALQEVRKAGVAERVDLARIRSAVREASGVPLDVTRE
jgi:L,D-transpeptidase ErfK/SrfK